MVRNDEINGWYNILTKRRQTWIYDFWIGQTKRTHIPVSNSDKFPNKDDRQ